MMKKIFCIAMASLIAGLSAYAAIPKGYYDDLEGKSNVALRNAAKATANGHKRITYSSGTWEAFAKTDVKIVDGREAWWDMYSNDIVYLPGHNGLNIEHSVAQSWWGGGHNNDQGCDLFHLNPSEANANNRKANYPLGEINGTPSWTNGVTNVGTPVSGQGGGSTRVYEPADEYKGDFARAFMYVFTVYNELSWSSTCAWMYDTANVLLFKPWAVELLLRWSAEDPVDEKEANRNEQVYLIQGNRNPFIDMPQLAEYIWGSKNTMPFHASDDITDPDPNPNPNPNPDEEQTLLSMDFDNISSLPAAGWTIPVVSGNLTGWYIKTYQNNPYAAASAYKGSVSGGPYEYWLVSPEIEVPDGCDATLTFRTQGAYYDEESEMNVWKMQSPDPSAAGAVLLSDAEICTPNANGAYPVYCDWVESGDVKLGSGKMYLGFRYYSAGGGSDNSSTYCLDDIKVVAKPSSGVSNVEIDITPVFVSNGRIVAPEGSHIFSMTGVEVSESPAPGIYLVVTPAGKCTKVIL